MIKVYCDCSGDEITDRNRIDERHFRLKAEVVSRDGKHRMQVEVMTGLDGTSNRGEFCKYCVIHAVQMADDRPAIVIKKQAPAWTDTYAEKQSGTGL